MATWPRRGSRIKMASRRRCLLPTSHGGSRAAHGFDRTREGSEDSLRGQSPKLKRWAWQGPNRVTADKLDIDRQHHILEAHGHVNSQFSIRLKNEDGKDGKTATSPKPAASVYTVVNAPDLVYSDETRLAFYQGGVELLRSGMTVTSHELRAYLKDSDSDSSLDKA